MIIIFNLCVDYFYFNNVTSTVKLIRSVYIRLLVCALNLNRKLSGLLNVCFIIFCGSTSNLNDVT